MKLILACTSGGHFSTMWGLKAFWSQHDRVWITDYKADTSRLVDSEVVYWLPYQPPRKICILFRNLPAIVKILHDEKPDVIISTGASIAVNFALAAKLLGIHFVYVESISRQDDLSLTGKLVYYLSDALYVQSKIIAQRYSRAIFRGYV